ncbi:MAG TPA: hypothetical protein VMI54_02280 [Polyangiaceae bacterium]|nr:hypothetical protein [Polyangiaceae bacterium]
MRSLAALGAVGLAVVALAGGCAGKQEPAAAGKDCYRDEDCQTGLVCVADASGNRVCSKDVKRLESMVNGPPAAAPTDTATGMGGAP